MTQNIPTSRGFFGYGCDALAGVVSALILGFALAHPASILVLLAYFAAVPLFIVGFAFGLRSGSIATVAGVVALLGTAPDNVAVFYAVADALPAFIVLLLSLRRHPVTGWTGEGAVLTALMLYPCAIFFAIYAVAAAHGGLLQQTVDLLNSATDQVSATLSDNGQTVTPEMTAKIHQYLEFLARVTPGVAMSVWLLVTSLAAIVAQSLLQPFGRNIRPVFTLDRLRLPNWVLLVALIAAAASFAPAPYDYVALNVAILFCMPFFFTGLAVVHAGAAQTRFPMLMLILFYVFIAYLLPLVALVGAVDQWGDFRKKFAQRAARQTTN